MKSFFDWEEEVAFCTQYEGIIYKVMKDLHVPRSHAQYEDFLQNGRIKLVEAYVEKSKQANFPEGFVGFAYRKVRWKLLDLLRKEQRHIERSAHWSDELNEVMSDVHTDMGTALCESEWVQQIWQALDAEEQRLIYEWAFVGSSVTDIAKKFGISRKTVYERRKKIQLKLTPYKMPKV